MTKEKSRREVVKEDISYKDIEGGTKTLAKSQPLQMSLFQTFLVETDKYSNTIDLYDAIPKYYPSRKLNKLREQGTYLPTLDRDFQYKHPATKERSFYKVVINPARIKTKDGSRKEFYPTEREEIVEEALHKIAADNLSGFYLNDEAGVQFTLYQLMQELKRCGHSIHLDSLVESLHVCNKSNIEVTKADGESILSSTIFPVLIIVSRDEWEKDPKNARCYVQFNPLVTQSINRLTYRQFDYESLMQYGTALSRWLHKKIFHNYINANYTNSYNIKASTIIRDSGLVNYNRLPDAIKAIDRCIKELKNSSTILAYEKELIYTDKKNKIADAKYIMTPSPYFVSEMKAANKRKQVIDEAAINAKKA